MNLIINFKPADYKRLTAKERADLISALNLDKMTDEELRELKITLAETYSKLIPPSRKDFQMTEETEELFEKWFATRRVIDDILWKRVAYKN